MHVELAPPEDEQPALQAVELPPMEAHHIDPFIGLGRAGPGRRGHRGRRPAAPAVAERRAAAADAQEQSDAVDPNDPATWGKVARNAPCPCGSGKKYKHCHGKHE